MAKAVETLNAADQAALALAARPIATTMTVGTALSVAQAQPAASYTLLQVHGYYAVGDCPVWRLRRAVGATELALPGLLTDGLGGKWLPAETLLYPEWFGAKGDATGVTGVGNDDAPAFRWMLAHGCYFKTQCTTQAGRFYRFASHTQHPGGQKTVLLPTSNMHFTVRSDLLHDSYDATSGAPMFIFTEGYSNKRVQRVRLHFEGGRLVFPTGAPARTGAKKGSICMYYVDDFYISRGSTSGPSPTNFQISIYDSSTGLIDGGYVGYPVGPTQLLDTGEYPVGDDGLHLIGTVRDVIARGLIITSGDDPISITCENNQANRTIERIQISDIICNTPTANVVKIHIVSTNDDTTNGCTIQDVSISNVMGRITTDFRGQAITIQNDDYTKNNVIRRIYIDNLRADLGTLPRSKPTVSLQGMAIRVYRADEVHITNSTIIGQQNSQLMFYWSKGSSFQGELINSLTNNASVTLLTGLTVASAVNSGAYRRVTFSGTADLTAVKAQVDAATAYANVNEFKYPILTLTGMTQAGYNGSFVIRAVDATNKTVDIELNRSGTSDETTATGTGVIVSGTMPVITLIDCEDCRIKARVVNPLSWVTAHVTGRSTTAQSTPSASLRCTVDLDIENQQWGYGILVQRANQGRYAVQAYGCKSGSYMLRAEAASGVTAPYNYFMASNDFAALADQQQGWGRTVLSDFATDRFDLIRGRTPTRFKGTVTQLSGQTTLGNPAGSGIGANASSYGGLNSNFVTPAHLLKLTPRTSGSGLVTDVSWSVANARFDVNTATAPSANVTWDYVVGFPD